MSSFAVRSGPAFSSSRPKAAASPASSSSWPASSAKSRPVPRVRPLAWRVRSSGAAPPVERFPALRAAEAAVAEAEERHKATEPSSRKAMTTEAKEARKLTRQRVTAARKVLRQEESKAEKFRAAHEMPAVSARQVRRPRVGDTDEREEGLVRVKVSCGRGPWSNDLNLLETWQED